MNQIPDHDWSEIEIYKFEFEYIKYISTLCTGSILLVVTFIEKLFKKPEWKICIAVALCSFLLSTIICAFSQACIIEKASERESIERRDKVQNLTIGLIFSSLLSYLIGVSSLVVFGLKNLF